MANSIRLGGGGSGGSATLITKSITQNGTYLAQDDNADGYSEVTVDVSGEGDLAPLSWSGETHTIGNKRSVSVDGYVLNAPCTQGTYCTGVISVPVTMPQGANAIVMEYDIVGASYSSEQWYATFFASDTVVTSEVAKETAYGYKKLTQKAISSGTSVVGLTEILSSEFLPSSDNFYINIQFGCTNFANIRIYAVDKTGSVVYEDLSSFAHYYKKNTTTPTITPVSLNEVSLTFQDQNASGYELCSFSVPLTKGIYVAEIYATLDKNTGLAGRYTWGIYSSNSSGGASLNDNSPLDNTAYDTYVPFDKSDTNEHYYEVPIKMLADGTAYICFAMADDNGVNATITVRSLKIRKAYGSSGSSDVDLLISNNAFAYQDTVSGTDVANAVRSWTFDKSGVLKFSPSSYAYTNTSSNDGFFDFQVNGVSVYKQYLTTNTNTPVTLNDIAISSGDTFDIVYGFDNTHSRCNFYLYTAISLLY